MRSAPLPPNMGRETSVCSGRWPARKMGRNRDVDFLVRFEPGTTLLDQAGLISDFERLLGRQVDVLSERGLKQRIRDRVLHEAMPL